MAFHPVRSAINVFRITAAMPAQNTEPERSGVQNSGNFCQTVMRSVHFPMIRQGCSSVLIRMYTILHVIPHVPLPSGSEKNKKTTETFNIGLIGVLCYKKGLEVVKALAGYIEENELNIRLRLIGTSDEEIESPVFSQTGRYTREEIPRLTLEQDIDMFLIPSVWPETFSYTTSEIISMGFPVAVLPVGAPVERVKRYAKGLVLKDEQPENIVEEMISLWKTLGESELPVEKRRLLFVGEEISFASRYRVEHFREQLILKGYASKFIQIDQAEQEKIEEYTAIVMYRCSKLMEAEMLANRAKAAGIPGLL